MHVRVCAKRIHEPSLPELQPSKQRDVHIGKNRFEAPERFQYTYQSLRKGVHKKHSYDKLMHG